MSAAPISEFSQSGHVRLPSEPARYQEVPAAVNMQGKVHISQEVKPLASGRDSNSVDFSQPVLDVPTESRTSLESFDAQAGMMLFLVKNTELANKQIEAATGLAWANLDRKKAVNQDRLDKLQESISHLQSSRKRKVFRDIFGWMASAFATLGAVGFAFATGGAGAPLSALALGASGVLGMVQQASSSTGDWMNKCFGNSETGIKVASIMWTVAIAGTGIMGSVGMARTLTTMGAEAGEQLGVIQRHVSSFAAIGEGATQIGKGGLEADSAHQIYRADLAQAAAKDLHGQVTRISHQIESDIDFVNNWYTVIAAGQQKIAAILAESQKSTENLIKNI